MTQAIIWRNCRWLTSDITLALHHGLVLIPAMLVVQFFLFLRDDIRRHGNNGSDTNDKSFVAHSRVRSR